MGLTERRVLFIGLLKMPLTIQTSKLDGNALRLNLRFQRDFLIQNILINYGIIIMNRSHEH